MDTKHIHCMLEDMAEYGKEMISCAVGSGNVNLDDAGKIIDIVKDLACAEKDALIAKEMRKANEEEEAEEKYMKMKMKEEHADEYKRYMDEYGEDGERRFYDAWRYKSGRFAPKGRGTRRGYDEPPYYHMNPEDYKAHDAEWYRDMDRKVGKLYYTEPIRMDGMREIHDRKDGKSWEKRRGYMETKEAHKDNTPQDKQEKMKSLEAYAKELTEDVIDMVSDATAEERNLLRQKMQMLVQKIPQ